MMLSDDDQSGVEAARDTIRSAILSGDSSAYALSFTEDGIVMHPDSPYVRGRSELEEYSARLFSAVKVKNLVLTPVTIDGDTEYAYEVGRQIVEVEPADERFKTERQYIHAYSKGPDGVWRIAAAMSGNS
jgi:uncharacterized protein (TIGR02246 family)